MKILSAWVLISAFLAANAAWADNAQPDLPANQCQLELNQPKQVVIGPEKWSSELDCSAVALVTRGEKGITVDVTVTDDMIWTKSDITHRCDSIELYFDVRPAKVRGGSDYEKGVFQMIIVPGMGAKPDRISFHFGTGSHDPEVEGVKSTSKRIKKKGYQMEIFLPFEGFKRNHFIPAKTFNFDMGINDADKDETESQLMWAGTDINFKDASKFATITPPPGKRNTPEVSLHLLKASQVVSGPDKWTGAKDCSGRASITLSDTGISINVTVTDDVIWTKSDSDYTNDSVELYFDVRPEKTRGSAAYSEGVLQMIIVPGFGKKPDRVSFHYGEGYHDPEAEGVKTSSKIISGKGYSMKIFLPFKGFKENHMIPGPKFNFDMGINDADGKERESHLIWAGTNENWHDASKFKKIDLSGKE